MGFWLPLPLTNKQHVYLFHLRPNHREKTYVERQHEKSVHIFNILEIDSSTFFFFRNRVTKECKYPKTSGKI